MSNDLYSEIEHFLINQSTDILSCSREDISYEADLDELGFESLTKNQLFLRINELLNTKLDPTVLLKYPSLEELGYYLVDHHKDELMTYFTKSKQAESA